MYKNILVAVALDHEHQNRRAFEIAKVLCAEGGNVTALHVISDVPGYVSQYLTEGQRSKLRDEVDTKLAAVTATWPDVKTDVLLGHSGRTILDYAESHKIDCIVLSSHKPGLPDYLLGSTAARVVRHARCSVHVIR